MNSYDSRTKKAKSMKMSLKTKQKCLCLGDSLMLKFWDENDQGKWIMISTCSLLIMVPRWEIQQHVGLYTKNKCRSDHEHSYFAWLFIKSKQSNRFHGIKPWVVFLLLEIPSASGYQADDFKNNSARTPRWSSYSQKNQWKATWKSLIPYSISTSWTHIQGWWTVTGTLLQFWGGTLI